ncbi:hypothetical protein IKG07_02145 [Candidatus Saccharibacteria bacterium]|nr:hypothetical protein [Candidatus Saccharibacteria bacterium]
MTLKKLLLTIAGAIAVLGAFLPWAAVTFFISVRLNPFQMGEPLPIILAILTLVCGVASILLNVLKEKQIKNIIKIKNIEKLPLFAGIALVAIAVIAFIYVKASTSGVANASFGIWLIGLAGVATIVLPYLKNVKALDKVVLGQPEKAEKKAEKPAKKETAKKK